MNTIGSEAGVRAGMHPRRGVLRHYTFVDYATQGYSVLVALLVLLFHNRTVPAWPWLLVAHAVFLLLVHWLIQAKAQNPNCKALDFLRHLYPVLLYTGFFCETGWVNRMFFTEYLDPIAIRWDQQLFGCQPSMLFILRLPYLAVSEVFYAAYFCYYLMIAGVSLALFLRNRQHFFHFVSVVSFLFYVCYLVYIILPIIGPRVFFSEVNGYVLPEQFKQLAPTQPYPPAVTHGVCFRLMGWIYDVFEAPGAALPSSHVAVALCTVFFSFLYLRRIRYFHLALTILLCLSTIYCHYHYVVDVLAGLITALILIPFGNWLYFRLGGSRGELEHKGPNATPG